ncbi:MAG TPA: type IV pilin protein [Lysobacter sp.]
MRQQTGFTLIELMIVVAIIAILAAIALPLYEEQVRKGRRADAMRAVGQLQLELERWRAENPCYGQPGAAPCTAFTASGTYPTVPTSRFYDIAIAAAGLNTYSVTATAKGEQLGDRCGVLTGTQNSNTKPQWATASCN